MFFIICSRCIVLPCIDIFTSEGGQFYQFIFSSFSKLLQIFFSRIASKFAGGRMGDHISCLESFCIGRYLEHQVLRETLTVVPEMESREMDILASIVWLVIINITIVAPVFASQPPHAALHKVLLRRRDGDARITMVIVCRAHIPCVL